MIDQKEDLISVLEAKYGQFTKGCAYYLPEGWFKLVDELLENLSAIPGWQSSFVVQIKEKFGGLRVYIQTPNDFSYAINDLSYAMIQQLITEAEGKSFHICQWCGTPGKTRSSSRHWVYTSCEEHIKD